MKRFFRKPSSVGHAPGTLVPTEKADQQPLTLTIFEYGPEMPVEQRQPQTISECFPLNPQSPAQT